MEVWEPKEGDPQGLGRDVVSVPEEQDFWGPGEMGVWVPGEGDPWGQGEAVVPCSPGRGTLRGQGR